MEQVSQAGSDLWAIIAVGVAIVGLQWRMTYSLEKRLKGNVSDAEKRIKENADQAHAQIGENINRVEKGLNQRMNDLRSDIKALTERFDRHLEHHS